MVVVCDYTSFSEYVTDWPSRPIDSVLAILSWNWRRRAGIYREQRPIRQVTVVGEQRMRPGHSLVAVSASCLLQCFDTVG